jgi:hypothetical protein
MGFFSRPTPTWLPRLLGPKILVTVKTGEIVFRARERVISLRPTLFEQNGRIVSVGIPPSEAAQELPIFVSEADDRSARIAKFFRYGLQTVVGRSFTIKPVVAVSVETQEVSLYEVTAALLAAGAAEVTVA